MTDWIDGPMRYPKTEPGTVAELLADLYEPRPWVRRDNFDPMHRMQEIRAAVYKGWLELDESSGNKETYRFRLTSLGEIVAARNEREKGATS